MTEVPLPARAGRGWVWVLVNTRFLFACGEESGQGRARAGPRTPTARQGEAKNCYGPRPWEGAVVEACVSGPAWRTRLE
ncbi:hypothetical protein GCM10022284_62000 [Streptomyces hundungensis]